MFIHSDFRSADKEQITPGEVSINNGHIPRIFLILFIGSIESLERQMDFASICTLYFNGYKSIAVSLTESIDLLQDSIFRELHLIVFWILGFRRLSIDRRSNGFPSRECVLKESFSREDDIRSKVRDTLSKRNGSIVQSRLELTLFLHSQIRSRHNRTRRVVSGLRHNCSSQYTQLTRNQCTSGLTIDGSTITKIVKDLD